MNRWSKYGGIMPETISLFNIVNVLNRYIYDAGVIGNSNNFHYYDDLYLKAGQYKVKNISVSNLNTGFNYRIHLFNIDKTQGTQILVNLLPNLVNNKIYDFIITVPNDGIVTFTMRKELNILSVERL